MPSYSYSVAKSVLNDMDKNRFLCLYLHSNQSAIDWKGASRDYGCASVDSFRVLTNRALKKIADAGGKLGEDGVVAVPAPPKKRRARKRKLETPEDTESEYGTKTKPKRGRKAKKEDEAEEENDASAKSEAEAQECEGTPESIGGV